jgi:hypothetical protein
MGARPTIGQVPETSAVGEPFGFGVGFGIAEPELAALEVELGAVTLETVLLEL